VQSGTIKNNITFGDDVDSLRLASVVRACGLTGDLTRLSHGIEYVASFVVTHIAN
jgi:hypothetical protein